MRQKPWNVETDEINLMIWCFLCSWASLLNVEQFLLQNCSVILEYFQMQPFLNKERGLCQAHRSSEWTGLGVKAGPQVGGWCRAISSRVLGS